MTSPTARPCSACPAPPPTSAATAPVRRQAARPGRPGHRRPTAPRCPTPPALIGSEAAVLRHLRAAQDRSVQPARASPTPPAPRPATPTRSTTVDPDAIWSAAYDAVRAPPGDAADRPAARRATTPTAPWIGNAARRSRAPTRAAYFPRLRMPDPTDDFRPRTVAPVRHARRAVRAHRRHRAGVWKAPAGTEAHAARRTEPGLHAHRRRERRAQPARPQLPAHLPGRRARSSGARAHCAAPTPLASQWKYVPVRRLALFIEESLYRGTKWAVFEPNDEPLWAQIRLNVGAFMHDLFRQGAFAGQYAARGVPRASATRRRRRRTTSNRGIVNIVVGFAPLKPAEFVVIQIQQLAGQSQRR